ncbi:MAG: transcriptional regulator [Thermoplasmata archaeon HGW-Thermoplasmata-1]|nr:MAG: transcriptional regulator [Thermoplasmata archaeon HGW-Thermoplasmata-1]
MSAPGYWREIPQRYNLLASRCGVCGDVDFPPRVMCQKCRRESIGRMERVGLSGRGNIVTYSILHTGMPAFSDQKPYVIAIIETEEGPRLTAQIVDCRHDDVKIGANVKSVFRKVNEDGKEGIISYGYKFTLVKE